VSKENTVTIPVSSGVQAGFVFASILSYAKWHSFWWMWLHGVFGWFYIIYYYIKGY